ncbi:ATP-binding cassette domain-containing protein [Moorella naiadis]|uniref:ABC transporter ATP-binding protein n=1 Tax=Moorella naiadis (nom. illeg.) TaxID=3093670 RepID=UPI003D9C8061
MIRATIKSFSYPGSATVLKDIDLHIQEGEFVVITGVSGAGKSTLARCLAGAIPHFFPGRLVGEVRVKSRELASLTLPAIATFMAYVDQEPQNQLFHLSVAEDVAFGAGNLGLEREEIRARVDGALTFVGGRHLATRSPITLSGGELQRCALATYIAMAPRVMILTVALNALIEKKGVKTALITTAGFRDALEIRRSRRKNQWDFRAPVPPVLVPRRLRFGLRERMDYRGVPLLPLDREQLAAIAAQLEA